MKRILFYTLLIFSFLLTACRHTTPQQKALLSQADSLIEARPDTALHLLKDIRNYHHLASPDRALYALLMSEALDKNDIAVESDSLIRIATDYYGNSEPQRAGYAWFYRARCENNRGNAQGQADALLKAQEFANQSNNYKLKGFIYSDKARNYESEKKLDSMLYYNRLAYMAIRKTNDRRNTIVGIFRIGYSHYLNSRFDSALVYFRLAKKQATTVQENFIVSSINRFMGLCYSYQKNYSQALYYLRQSMAVSDKSDYSKYFCTAFVLNKVGKSDSAKYYLKKCTDPHELAPDYYRLWQDVSKNEGNLNLALQYANKEIAAKDSLSKRSLKESFAGIERRYNFQLLLTEKNKLAVSSQHKTIYLFIALILLFLVIIFVLLVYASHKKKALAQQKTLVIQERERATLLEHQFQLKQVLFKKIEAFKNSVQIAQNMAQAPSKKETKRYSVQQIEELLSNIDAYYNQLSTRLTDKYPTLNTTEIHILLLILAGFTSVQIAGLLDTSDNSINVTRTVIRKKMHLETKTDLADFLSSF